MEISNAYSKALELEGLLLLLKSENIDNFKIDLIFTRIFEKVDEISAEMNAIRLQYKIDLYNAAKQHVEENSRIISEPEISETVGADMIEECAVTASDDNQDDIPAAETEEPGQPAVTEVSDKEDDLSVEDTVEAAEDCACESPEDDAAVADNALFEEMEDADVEPTVVDVPDVETEEHADDAESQHQVNIVIEEAGVDVNRSAFALSARGDIRKIFTLNDIYKFRRQLFSNSQEQFSQALSLIESMKSTYEADDYFYNTLKWDKENPDVKDFMSTISAYFMGK